MSVVFDGYTASILHVVPIGADRGLQTRGDEQNRGAQHTEHLKPNKGLEHEDINRERRAERGWPATVMPQLRTGLILGGKQKDSLLFIQERAQFKH